jgi:hypothetical protein
MEEWEDRRDDKEIGKTPAGWLDTPPHPFPFLTDTPYRWVDGLAALDWISLRHSGYLSFFFSSFFPCHHASQHVCITMAGMHGNGELTAGGIFSTDHGPVLLVANEHHGLLCELFSHFSCLE